MRRDDAFKDDDKQSNPIECAHCGTSFFADDVIDGMMECPFCGENILVKDNDSYPQNTLLQRSLFYPEIASSAPYKKRYRGLKNFFAIIIGILGGLFVRTIIAIPASIFLSTEDGLPQDITLLLEMFSAFIAGALAASLVPDQA
ncbi:MAG: hypothetical protein GXY44_13565 [Phycisphaerales bacterium]|nr:hypothetical protein [Phycisphaerales bacterium]